MNSQEDSKTIQQEKNPIQVADRLFQAMELLASNGAMGLMDITNTLKLNKSTTHRILNSLIYMGYAKQNPEGGKYELTFKLVDLSSKIMSRLDIVNILRPHLRQLMELTGETVHFVERDGLDAVYIDKVDSYSNSVQMISHIGSRIPLYCSGVGKAIAAQLPFEEVNTLWSHSKVVRKTPYTITDFDEFLKCLEDIRQRGYALDNEENESGVRCIAACLCDYQGKPRYAFSISAPVSRMDNDRIKELSGYVLKAKAQMESEFRS